MLNVDQMGFAAVIHTQFENREPFGTPDVVALVEIGIARLGTVGVGVIGLVGQVFNLSNQYHRQVLVG